jgi:tRNA pseudouridine13 synthase
MNTVWPCAGVEPLASAVIRRQPEDFLVQECLGFEPSGDGEHAFISLEKRELTTSELVQRVAAVSGVTQRDIGVSGQKDRNAVTQQWLSVGLAGKPEPRWQELEQDGHVRVLHVARHQRKLRTGVHSGNRFSLRLSSVRGDHQQILQALSRVRASGFPNYFGPQRFGRDGSTLHGATRWAARPVRLGRNKRSLYLSALRGFLFNELLAHRVRAGNWNRLQSGDQCMLHGSRSFFACATVDDELALRAQQGDIHPGLPLWGVPQDAVDSSSMAVLLETLGENIYLARALEQQGLVMAYRAARVSPDDFSWQFCDDDGLRLDFFLPAGSYATALLAEVVQYTDGSMMSGNGSEQS